MPRRLVTFEPEHYYHLYNRGCDRRSIFFERDNYLYFLRLIRHHLVGEVFDVVAYCLMPNHYHLLVQFKGGDASEAMKRLGLAYTKAMNQRYQRQGTLFQGRFQSIGVDRDDYLRHLVRYIHLNPVKAGIVTDIREWEFSSYLEYAGLRGGTLPHINIIKQQFASEADYHSYLENSYHLNFRHLEDAGNLKAKIKILMLDE